MTIGPSKTHFVIVSTFMERTARRKNRFPRIMQRIRVPIGFLLAPLMLFAAKPTWTTISIGGAVSVVGLGIRAWASGHLRKNERLAVTGPYAYTRNPLYFGTLIMGAGIAVGAGTLWFALLFISMYLIIYSSVMIAEGETMTELFGDGYEKYRKNVPMLLPRLTAWRGDELSRCMSEKPRFDLTRYLKHREYRASIGLAIVFASLIAKMLLTRQ